MFDPTAMIMADRATKDHVLSARPAARTRPERPGRRRRHAVRRLTATVLRRLADRVEPRAAATCVPAS